MDKDKKRELIDSYKNRTITGGVYCIQCSGNQRRWIKSTTDMAGSKSRFLYAVQTKSCPGPAMLRECTAYGIGSFSFVILEELVKKETQTAAEFADDINTLYELWLEKYKHEDLG